jgi:hypothetical protein
VEPVFARGNQGAIRHSESRSAENSDKKSRRSLNQRLEVPEGN